MFSQLRLAWVALATVLSGCFIQPYDWQVTGGGSTGPFTAAGYTDIPNATVVIEMQDWDGTWLQVAATQSASTPTYTVGAWSQNSPALYYFGTTVYPTGESWYDGKVGIVRMRNTSNNTTLYGGDVNSLGCFLNTILPTSDFYGVAWNCGYNRNQVTIDNGNIR
jgi:hypothetical protein